MAVCLCSCEIVTKIGVGGSFSREHVIAVISKAFRQNGRNTLDESEHSFADSGDELRLD